MKRLAAEKSRFISFGRVCWLSLVAFVVAAIGLWLSPVHSRIQSASPAATFTVTTVTDENGVCDVNCSLREAITAANASSGADTISFNIPGTAPFVIQPTSALPEITGAVTIDGYTQPGASPNTLPVGSDANILIVLDGSLAGSFSIGMSIGGGTTVKGLKIVNWGLYGIWVRSPGNNVVEGNHIRAAFRAVSLDSADNTIGGTPVAARNVLTTSAANDFIIATGGFGSNNNTIRGNYIGTAPDGMSIDTAGLGGINITFGSHTIIGNVIAGSATTSTSNGKGIRINTPGNTIQGNLIGVKADGTGSLPNQREGIELRAPSNIVGGPNPMEGNMIANSGSDGIFVSGNGNRISGNSIFSNAGAGIDLSPDGIAVNDGCDADTGANRLQNFPVIGIADSNSGNTTIAGVLNSTANQIFTIDFFSNDACEASGNGEGKTYLGSTLVSTDTSCNANFNQNFAVDLPSSQFITATATNNTTGDTSEFSMCKQVNSPPEAFVDLLMTKTDSADPVAVNNSLTYSLNVANVSGNTADDVVVTDNLPASMTFVSASAICSHSGGTVTCNFGSIAGGASAGASVVVTPTVLGNITNTAIVATSDVDTNTDNNTDSETTAVIPPLSATLTDSPDPIEAGSNLIYTVNVMNHDSAAGNNMQVTDALPASVTFISASTNCNHSAGTVTCDLGTLSGGTSASAQIVVRANQSGTLNNLINVTSANLGGATASASTFVFPDIPSTDNYVFSTAANGSLADMSAATLLINANQTNVASTVSPINFDFFFMGAPTPARFTHFSVNSNGVLQLGPTQILANMGSPLGFPNVISPIGKLQKTSLSGGVRYKMIGSAPARILVVEWFNMDSSTSGGVDTADLTYQLQLHETSGVIEFVYGSMAQAFSNSSAQIGFSSAFTYGSVGTVTAPQSGSPPPSYNGATITLVNNPYSVGVISVLNSTANGSRRVFTFTPPVPAAPTNLTFSNVSFNSLTLNWADNSTDENGFAIYGSTDGSNFAFVRTVGRNAVSTSVTALEPLANYTFRVHAVSESGLSAFAQASQTTGTTSGSSLSTATGGNWNSPSTWAGGVVPTASDNVTIAAGATVLINIFNPAAYDLTVNGTLEFSPSVTTSNMIVHSITIAGGGIFRSPSSGSLVHTLNVGGSFTNEGTLDFSTNSNTAGVNLVHS